MNQPPPHPPEDARGTSTHVHPALHAVLESLRTREGVPRRREDGREVAIGAKGARTRQRVMDAASEVFVERGYQYTSVAMVTERAGVSQGTFYQYFRDRADVVTALVADHVAHLLDRKTGLAWNIQTGRPGLHRFLKGYAEVYAARASFSRVWEEVSQTHPEFTEVRLVLTRLVEHSIEKELLSGQRAGLLPATLNEALVARALTAMTDRFCYLSYVADPTAPPLPAQQAADVLSDLWAAALRLTEHPSDAPGQRRRSPG